MNEVSSTNIQQEYVPSSLEKKRVVLAYALLGIFVYMTKKEVSVYEQYHVQFATWWWMLFVVVVLVSIVPLLLVPFLLGIFVVILCYIPLFAVLLYTIKQARDGKYIDKKTKETPVAFIPGIWGWFFDVFDMSLKVNTSSQTHTNFQYIPQSNLQNVPQQPTVETPMYDQQNNSDMNSQQS